MLNTIKILLAEDAKTMRKIEVKALEDIGFTDIVEANDGEEAIQIIDESIDLIISDWNMPNKSGYDFLVWVRENEKFKDIPFIMATAQSDKGHFSKAEEAGVSAFIAKPFANDELKKTIEDIFSESGPDEEKHEVNIESEDGKVILNVAHIQITDHLILGVVKDMIEKGEVNPQFFKLETLCMSGWNSVYNDLEKGKVNAACVLAPIAMDLSSSGTPLKLILLAHRGGSVLVKSMKRDQSDNDFISFYQDSSFLIPHKMSVHHMLTDIFFKGIGLNANLDKGDEYDIELEVVPPVHMSEFLSNNTKNSGFMVAEPIGSQAVNQAMASIEFYSNEIWENHPCCVFAARQEFLDNYPDAAQEFVDLLVQAGQVIENDPDRASEIAVKFLDPEGKIGLAPGTIKRIITDKNGLKTNDLYPNKDDLKQMQDYMVNEMEMEFKVDMDSFVDLRYAEYACMEQEKVQSVLHNDPEYIMDLIRKHEIDVEYEGDESLEESGSVMEEVDITESDAILVSQDITDSELHSMTEPPEEMINNYRPGEGDEVLVQGLSIEDSEDVFPMDDSIEEEKEQGLTKETDEEVILDGSFENEDLHMEEISMDEEIELDMEPEPQPYDISVDKNDEPEMKDDLEFPDNEEAFQEDEETVVEAQTEVSIPMTDEPEELATEEVVSMEEKIEKEEIPQIQTASEKQNKKEDEIKPFGVEAPKKNLAGKYLTFSLSGQEYGINILKIKEIIGMMNINTLPRLPAHIKGVINLRNKVIPIMDLRRRFGMDEAEYTERTCIIIIEVEMKGEIRNIGLIVDSVSEVLPIDDSEVEEPPSLNLTAEKNFILAMAKKKDSVKTLLNIEKVVN